MRQIIIITNNLIVDVWLLGKYFLTQKQGEVTLKDVEKSIQELPLPEKIRALAIYKRYKHIRKVEDEMKKAVKAVEKDFLKLDAPLLDNISKLVQGQKPVEEK